MQMETIVVMQRAKRNEEGVIVEDAKELIVLDEARVEKASSREDVLRRKDVGEATEGIPGAELEVLVASVPFRALCGDC